MRSCVSSTFLAAAFVLATVPVFSQVRSAGKSGKVPLVVGAGFSNFNVDFGAGRREDGGTVWADWTIQQMPRILKGIGVEIEARDLSFGAPSLPNMRYDTAGGGIVYHYLHLRHLHPYAKFLEQYGSIDFPPYPGYAHDTRSLSSFGGGADIHAWRNVWVRADYEYQIWQHLFGHKTALTPNGVTFGPEYDFGGR